MDHQQKIIEDLQATSKILEELRASQAEIWEAIKNDLSVTKKNFVETESQMKI